MLNGGVIKTFTLFAVIAPMLYSSACYYPRYSAREDNHRQQDTVRYNPDPASFYQPTRPMEPVQTPEPVSSSSTATPSSSADKVKYRTNGTTPETKDSTTTTSRNNSSSSSSESSTRNTGERSSSSSGRR